MSLKKIPRKSKVRIRSILLLGNNKALVLGGKIDENDVFSVTFYEPKNDLNTLLQKEKEKQGIINERNESKNASKNYNSTGGNIGISKAEKQNIGEKTDFKLSERTRKIKKISQIFGRFF